MLHEQVRAEQQGAQDCMESCGQYDTKEWGKLFDPPEVAKVIAGTDVGDYFKKRFGISYPDFKGDFNKLQDRVDYGIKVCCPQGKEGK